MLVVELLLVVLLIAELLVLLVLEPLVLLVMELLVRPAVERRVRALLVVEQLGCGAHLAVGPGRLAVALLVV